MLEWSQFFGLRAGYLRNDVALWKFEAEDPVDLHELLIDGGLVHFLVLFTAEISALEKGETYILLHTTKNNNHNNKNSNINIRLTCIDISPLRFLEGKRT